MGSLGINARNTFVLRVEHPYVVKKLEKSMDVVSPPSMLRKLCVTDCSSKPECICFSFSMANHSRKLHKKQLVRAVAHGIRRFNWALSHQIAECTWACPPGVPPPSLGRAWYLFSRELVLQVYPHPPRGEPGIFSHMSLSCRCIPTPPGESLVSFLTWALSCRCTPTPPGETLVSFLTWALSCRCTPTPHGESLESFLTWAWHNWKMAKILTTNRLRFAHCSTDYTLNAQCVWLLPPAS